MLSPEGIRSDKKTNRTVVAGLHSLRASNAGFRNLQVAVRGQCVCGSLAASKI